MELTHLGLEAFNCEFHQKILMGLEFMKYFADFEIFVVKNLNFVFKI